MVIRKQAGFTLVELMVTMVIFVFIIAAASNMFTGVLNQYKQQSKIAETNIEGNVGLQMLRTDIEQAGFGLPYSLDGVTYSEVPTGTRAANYNDATDQPPRPFVMDDNVSDSNGGFNQSDVLVVKSTAITTADAVHKWAYISNIGIASGVANNVLQTWTNKTGGAISDENLVSGTSGDKVVVLRPVSGGTQNILVHSGGTFYATFDTDLSGTFPSAFQPSANSYETYLVFGLAPSAITPRMPFNRADYYISSSNVPSRCAPHTGVLVKSVISQSNGSRDAGLPLLDCVADFQLAFAKVINNSESYATTLTGTADEMRSQLKEVRVYILAHEGQKDPFYSYPSSTVTIADPDVGVGTPLKTFDLNSVIGPSYVNYRWKLYTMVIRPFNLR